MTNMLGARIENFALVQLPCLRNQFLGGNRGVFEVVGYAAVKHGLTVVGIKLHPQRLGSRDRISSTNSTSRTS